MYMCVHMSKTGVFGSVFLELAHAWLVEDHDLELAPGPAPARTPWPGRHAPPVGLAAF